MKDPERTQELRAEFLLLLVVIIWGSNYALAKFAIATMNVFVFNAIRFCVAAVSLIAMVNIRREWKQVHRRDWRELVRAGLVANVFYQSAFIVGLSMTSAGNSAVIMATSPLWTTVINARMHRERIPLVTVAGMTLSLFGVVMIILGSGKKLELGGHEIIGDLVCFAAAVLLAVNTNLQKPLLVRYSPLLLATVMVGVGAVGTSLVAIPFAVQTSWSEIGWELWFVTALSGALSIGIANAFWSYGVRHIGPHRTSAFSNLIPVVAFIVSYVTLAEELNLMQQIGAVVTIGGVWMGRR